MRALIPLMLAGCCIAFPVMAQDTNPAKDLAKENRDLTAYAATLEQQIIHLRQRLQEEDQLLRALREKEQFPQAPYRTPPDRNFIVPQSPYRMPHVLPPDRNYAQPMPYRINPAPGSQAPGHDGWQSFKFNGADVYLIPVKEGMTPLKSPTTRPAPYRMP